MSKKTGKSSKPTELDRERVADIRRRLLVWYRKNKRSLPWRDAPTPYGVWVSEVMLQQTRVEVVRDYYARFMGLFPDIRALATAEEGAVLNVWQGLGYYSRARRLREGAQHVVRELAGELPKSAEQLQQIPGIGPYSAGAISSIAFGQQSPLVDGNVIRVLSRLFALSGDPAKSPLKQEMWRIAGELVPAREPGDFNQGLMELGATVCSPTKPSCFSCPLQGLCLAEARGQVSSFPQLKKKEKPIPFPMVMLLVRHRGAFAVTTLGAEARWWRGLDVFPFRDVDKGEEGSRVAREFASSFARASLTKRVARPALVALSPITHSVTKFRVTVEPFVLSLTGARPSIPHLRWVSSADLVNLNLPSPHRKVLQQIEEYESKRR